MFGLGVPELLIILAVVLLLFGGARIAGLGKSTGRALREFKEETKSIKADEAENARPAEPYRPETMQQPPAQPPAAPPGTPPGGPQSYPQSYPQQSYPQPHHRAPVVAPDRAAHQHCVANTAGRKRAGRTRRRGPQRHLTDS